jgi:hypothetical protein
MQMKNIQKEGSLRKYWFFFIFYILTILLIFLTNGGVSWFLLFLFSTFMSLFFFLTYWQIFILPDFSLFDYFTFAKYIILNQLFKIPIIQSVKDGEIIGDYGLLRIKPSIRIIDVDQKSAVLLEDDKKHTSILFNGTHLFRNNPKIIGTFSLGFRYIHLGPVDQYTLAKQSAKENLTDYHTRITQAGITKTQLHSGAFIYPSFSVFYRLDIKSLGTNKLNEFLSRTMLFKEIGLSIISPRQFENFLINKILEDWLNFCNSNEDEKILAKFPGKFEHAGEIIEGVFLQVFIDNIF